MSNEFYEHYPGQHAQRDDQTNTGTCVMHALSKAVTNYLHVKKLIDVKQSEVTRMLIHKAGMVCGIRKIGEKDVIGTFDQMTLILQDTDNLIKGFDCRSWWEVLLILHINNVLL